MTGIKENTKVVSSSIAIFCMFYFSIIVEIILLTSNEKTKTTQNKTKQNKKNKKKPNKQKTNNKRKTLLVRLKVCVSFF